MLREHPSCGPIRSRESSPRPAAITARSGTYGPIGLATASKPFNRSSERKWPELSLLIVRGTTDSAMIQKQQNAEFMQAEPMPAIVVSDTDYNRLVDLAAAVEEREPHVSSVLQSEMTRAQVVPA